MKRYVEDILANRLVRQAIEVADDPYREFVASLIRADDHAATIALEDVRRILGRAWILESLHGAARIHRWLRLSGMELPADPAPLPRLLFARDEDPLASIESSVLFEPGEFREAVESFRSTVPRLAEHVAAMQEQAERLSQFAAARERVEALPMLARKSVAIREAIARSFRVANTTIETTINLRELIASAIEGGISADAGDIVGVAEFVTEARLRGAAHLSSARLETVFRNNLSRAFNEGQMSVVRQPPVKAVVPLLELVEIHDRRTRGSPLPEAESPEGYHWQMHGFVGTAEDFDRLGIVPPNDHNCRGGVRPIPFDEAEELGFVDEDGEPIRDAIDEHNGERIQILADGLYPAPGFGAEEAERVEVAPLRAAPAEVTA